MTERKPRLSRVKRKLLAFAASAWYLVGRAAADNVTPPDSPIDDPYLDPWIEGELTAFYEPYSELLGPVAAVLVLLPPAAAYSIQSDSQTMPLVLFILFAGVLGTIVLPASALQAAMIIGVLGTAFVGVKLYMESGRKSR